MRAVIASSLGALLSLGCSHTPRPVIYGGRTENPVVAAATVEEAAVQPSGYDVLGRVWSRCTAEKRVAELDEAWLKDVACSKELLVEALRDKTASVGGELLVGRRCVEHPSGEAAVVVTCAGLVMRSTEDERAQEPLDARRSASAPGALDDTLGLPAEHVTDAWRIAVDFIPARSKAPRDARRIDLVGEREAVPINEKRIGDIVARCHGTCDEDSVRVAVRAAGAQVGANDVSEVRCVEDRPGWVCTGRASVYRKRPSDDPATW